MSPGCWLSPVVPLSMYNGGTLFGSTTFNHGLGTRHLRVTCLLVCLKADRGFTPGQEIEASGALTYTTGSTYQPGPQIIRTDQTVTVNFAGANSIQTSAGAIGSALTQTNWGLRVIVEALAA
jgi:hypothetical protein